MSLVSTVSGRPHTQLTNVGNFDVAHVYFMPKTPPHARLHVTDSRVPNRCSEYRPNCYSTAAAAAASTAGECLRSAWLTDIPCVVSASEYMGSAVVVVSVVVVYGDDNNNDDVVVVVRTRNGV